jgi:hypothetical protein
MLLACYVAYLVESSIIHWSGEFCSIFHKVQIWRTLLFLVTSDVLGSPARKKMHQDDNQMWETQSVLGWGIEGSFSRTALSAKDLYALNSSDNFFTTKLLSATNCWGLETWLWTIQVQMRTENVGKQGDGLWGNSVKEGRKVVPSACPNEELSSTGLLL